MGCGDIHTRKSDCKSTSLFISPKGIEDENLKSLFFRTLELKANEESFLSDLRNYNYATFEPVLQKHGYLSLIDFVAFFKFFGQEEHWNVPITAESLRDEFEKSAQNGCWELEKFIEYFRAVIGGILAEVRFELKDRNLFLGAFYVARKRGPDLAATSKEGLETLTTCPETVIEKAFAGAAAEDEKGLRKDSPKLLDALKQVSYYLPVERVTTNYAPLVPAFCIEYDRNKDGYIDKKEFATFLREVNEQAKEYLEGC